MMTAKETYTKVTGCIINYKDVEQAMIEFAKMHVEAALKAACRKWDADWRESLVEKTYPLTNIK